MTAQSVAPPSAWTPGPGDLVAGKYRVTRVVSQRRTSIVLDVKQEPRGRAAALAVLRMGEASPEQIERFVEHARAVASIRSDHVAQVLEIGELEDGSPFVVMDRLVGDDLGQLLETEGPLDVERAVDLMLQAVEALAAAHAVGVVHRDLRPTELLLLSGPAGGLLKVTEFPGVHVRIGVSPYTAPELVRDPGCRDVRSDVWAAGAVLYELLTGVPPFAGDTEEALAAAITGTAARDLSDLRWEIPGQLAAVVMKCLQRDANARYPDVDDLAVALAPFGSGQQAPYVAKAQAALSKAPPAMPMRMDPASVSGQVVVAPAGAAGEPLAPSVAFDTTLETFAPADLPAAPPPAERTLAMAGHGVGDTQRLPPQAPPPPYVVPSSLPAMAVSPSARRGRAGVIAGVATAVLLVGVAAIAVAWQARAHHAAAATAPPPAATAAPPPAVASTPEPAVSPRPAESSPAEPGSAPEASATPVEPGAPPPSATARPRGPSKSQILNRRK